MFQHIFIFILFYCLLWLFPRDFFGFFHFILKIKKRKYFETYLIKENKTVNTLMQHGMCSTQFSEFIIFRFLEWKFLLGLKENKTNTISIANNSEDYEPHCNLSQRNKLFYKINSNGCHSIGKRLCAQGRPFNTYKYQINMHWTTIFTEMNAFVLCICDEIRIRMGVFFYEIYQTDYSIAFNLIVTILLRLSLL